MRFSPSCLLAFVLAIPVVAVAQEESPDFALFVKSAEPTVATAVGRAFGQTEAPMRLAEGEHYVMLVDTEGRVTTRLGQGNVGLIELRAQPRALMALFAEEVESARAVAQMAMGMSFGRTGGDPAAVARLVHAVFAFPRQVDVLHVKVTGDESAGFHAVVDLSPVAGSGFAGFVGHLRPSAAEVPVLSGDAGMYMSASIDPSCWSELFEPLMEFSESFTGLAKNSMVPMFEQFLPLMDGTIALSWDLQEGMVYLTGLRDAQGAAAYFASEEYRKILEDMYEQSDFLSGTFTQNAFEHEGVAVHRVTLNMDTGVLPPSPLFPDGVMEEYVAVAGDFMVMELMGSSDLGIRSLVDRALAGEIETRKVSPEEMLSLSLNMAALAAITGQPMPPDMPGAVAVNIGVVDGSLRIDVNVD